METCASGNAAPNVTLAQTICFSSVNKLYISMYHPQIIKIREQINQLKAELTFMFPDIFPAITVKDYDWPISRLLHVPCSRASSGK